MEESPKPDMAELHAQAHTIMTSVDVRQLEVGARGTVGGDLALFSVFDGVPPDQKQAFLNIAKATGEQRMQRSLGAMMGMAIGDAVGGPLEFMDVVDEPGVGAASFDAETCSYVGRPRNMFGLKPGQWTDDTSMGLCVADSLIARGCCDGSDMVTRFWNWNCRGYNNAFRHDVERMGDEATRQFMIEAGLDATASLQSVGCGKGTQKQLFDLEEGKPPPPECPAEPAFDGNGALIRLAPVPIFCTTRSAEECANMARASSRTTHSGREVAEAAAFQAFLMHKAINRPGSPLAELAAVPSKEEAAASDVDSKLEPIRAFVDGVVGEYITLLEAHAATEPAAAKLMRLLQGREDVESTELCWNWRTKHLAINQTLTNRGAEYNGNRTSAEYFGSYALDALALALWGVYGATSATAAVVRCVNLLGDADSTACVAGQIAGAFYGASGFDPRLIELLRRWDPDADLVDVFFGRDSLFLRNCGLCCSCRAATQLEKRSTRRRQR